MSATNHETYGGLREATDTLGYCVAGRHAGGRVCLDRAKQREHSRREYQACLPGAWSCDEPGGGDGGGHSACRCLRDLRAGPPCQHLAGVVSLTGGRPHRPWRRAHQGVGAWRGRRSGVVADHDGHGLSRLCGSVLSAQDGPQSRERARRRLGPQKVGRHNRLSGSTPALRESACPGSERSGGQASSLSSACRRFDHLVLGMVQRGLLPGFQQGHRGRNSGLVGTVVNVAKDRCS